MGELIYALGLAPGFRSWVILWPGWSVLAAWGLSVVSHWLAQWAGRRRRARRPAAAPPAARVTHHKVAAGRPVLDCGITWRAVTYADDYV